MQKPNFQVGDTVRRISGSFCGMEIGDEAVIVEVPSDDSYGGLVLTKGGRGHSRENFEIVRKASTSRNKTDKVTVVMTLEELAICYMTFSKCHGRLAGNLYRTAKAALDPSGVIRESTFLECSNHDLVSRINNSNDIMEKLFPKPVKTAHEIKIEELEDTMRKAAKQIEQLKAMKQP